MEENGVASAEDISQENSDIQADSPIQSDGSEVSGTAIQSFVIDFSGENVNKDHSLQDAFLLYKKKRQVLIIIISKRCDLGSGHYFPLGGGRWKSETMNHTCQR